MKFLYAIMKASTPVVDATATLLRMEFTVMGSTTPATTTTVRSRVHTAGVIASSSSSTRTVGSTREYSPSH